MFYSHEILTQRKYGVATVWLVATLGAKSTLTRKITRKQIVEVDVPKACETIITPEVPLALRLQSSLLFGIARVYSSQVGYVLTDAQYTQNMMRQMLKVVRAAELDPEAGRTTRPDQLLVPDDPNFAADLAFNLDLSNLEPTTEASSQSESVLSPHSLQSSKSSQVSIPNLIIPSSSGGSGGGYGGFNLPGDLDQGMAQGDFDNIGGDDGFLPEVNFTFDEDGNLHELGGPGAGPIAQSEPTVRYRAASDGEDAAAQIQSEHEQSQLASEGRTHIEDVAMDDGLPPIGDYEVLPEAEPFPEREQPEQEDRQSQRAVRSSVNEESPEFAEAPMAHKRRAPKPIAPDRTIELHSTDLQAWNREYLQNMTEAASHKMRHKLPFQAKKNARHLIWGSGLGGIGDEIGHLGIPNPLSMFYGQGLFETITGIKTDVAGQKRNQASVEREEGEGGPSPKRQRSRSIDDAARGEEGPGLADDGLGGVGWEGDQDLEVGRRAPTPQPGDLGDRSSSMPWNRSAASSAARPHLSASGQHQRRGSRAVTASPLPGRTGIPSRHGSRQPSLPLGTAAPRPPAGLSSSISGDAGFDDFGVGGVGDEDAGGAPPHHPEFEMFGPAAYVDTQTAAASQWVRKILDQESGNFLEFVQAAMAERRGADEGDGGGEAGRGITFEELLPPEENSRVVAAQGLLHVLTLATRRVLAVEQEGDFGPIWLDSVAASPIQAAAAG